MAPLPVRRHGLSSRLFSAALGLGFFSAFASLGLQVRGLCGARGIVPIADFLQAKKVTTKDAQSAI